MVSTELQERHVMATTEEVFLRPKLLGSHGHRDLSIVALDGVRPHYQLSSVFSLKFNVTLESLIRATNERREFHFDSSDHLLFRVVIFDNDEL